MSAYLILFPGTEWVSQVLIIFSLYMSRLITPANPPESHQIDSFVLASVNPITSPFALRLLTMLKQLQGCAYPLWPVIVLCVRFAWPLFTFATVVTVNNVPPETQHSILMAG